MGGLVTIAMAATVPSPNSQGTSFTTPMGFLFLFLKFKNHLGGQMKGSEMKGIKAKVVFIAMAASRG
jgi:hypothetical protein